MDSCSGIGASSQRFRADAELGTKTRAEAARRAVGRAGETPTGAVSPVEPTSPAPMRRSDGGRATYQEVGGRREILGKPSASEPPGTGCRRARPPPPLAPASAIARPRVPGPAEPPGWRRPQFPARAPGHQPVNPSEPSSRKVLTRCNAIQTPRAGEESLADVLEQHEPGPDQRLGDDEDDREPDSSAAGRRAPVGKARKARTRSPTTSSSATPLVSAVPELDHRRDARRARHDLAVAERPVAAAAGAGAGGSHVGAPEDDGEVDRDRDPGEAGERRAPGDPGAVWRAGVVLTGEI